MKRKIMTFALGALICAFSYSNTDALVIPGHWIIHTSGSGCAINIVSDGHTARWDCDGSDGTCASVGGDGSLILNDAVYNPTHPLVAGSATNTD
jgi:hypothetical protein